MEEEDLTALAETFIELFAEFNLESEEVLLWALRISGYQVSNAINPQRRQDAVFLLAAHNLERRRTALAESATRLAAVGEGQSVSPVSVSTNASTRDILMLTPYGQQYLNLMNAIRPNHSFGLAT